MFGHRSFLVIGEADADIRSLTQGALELSNYHLYFDQSVDDKGRAQTSVLGGCITAVVTQYPTQDLVTWGLKPRERRSGAIILLDDNNQPLDKVLFRSAACVGFQIDYMHNGSAYPSTCLRIFAKEIVMGLQGNVEFKNRWTED